MIKDLKREFGSIRKLKKKILSKEPSIEDAIAKSMQNHIVDYYAYNCDKNRPKWRQLISNLLPVIVIAVVLVGLVFVVGILLYEATEKTTVPVLVTSSHEATKMTKVKTKSRIPEKQTDTTSLSDVTIEPLRESLDSSSDRDVIDKTNNKTLSFFANLTIALLHKCNVDLQKAKEQTYDTYIKPLANKTLQGLTLREDFSWNYYDDTGLVRCDSLDAGSGCDNEVTDRMTFDPEGPDPPGNLEPSPAELAQCEAEVGTLLSIIAELNKKMGSLKAPSEPGDLRPPGPSRPLVPDLLSHRLARSSPDRHVVSAIASKPPLTDRGGSGVMWTKLQQVLSSVEDSISCRRTWAAPITASDQYKHEEHLRAAQENWVKATQMLEEMESEFGISFPPKDQYQGVIVDLEKHDSALRSLLHSHEEELEKAQNTISQMEEEQNKLVGLHKGWRSGSRSPSYRSTAGPLSPDVASAPYPGSPLLHRRTARGLTPLSAGGDVSPLSSVNSGSPCSSPISQESETERLNRYIERLKARNERLTAALERRKAESEQISITLNRLESHCSALQLALKYCEECEEAYGELLSLYESKRQQSIPLQMDPAEAGGDRQQLDSPSSQLRNMGTEELSTSFSTAGVTEETETQSYKGQRPPEPMNREAVLRQQIERLKRDRAAICLPKPNPGAESKLSPETNHQAGSRGGHVTKDNVRPPDVKKEKASLFYELISVREEMSDLRSLIRLKEKELRCLEWSLMAQKAQEAAGVFIPESLREELEEDRKSEQQRLCDITAKLGSDGDIAGPRTRPILKELQAVLQREQALKKRLALVHDSLNTALSDSASHRRDNGEQIARLTQAHSKALSSYRQIRRKYREQVWRLEQKVVAMTESHLNQSGAPKTPEEAVEWRREETILRPCALTYPSRSAAAVTGDDTTLRPSHDSAVGMTDKAGQKFHRSSAYCQDDGR
ncbi:hypothetical protein INR49_025306, partial [Caranx melampygus]